MKARNNGAIARLNKCIGKKWMVLAIIIALIPVSSGVAEQKPDEMKRSEIITSEEEVVDVTEDDMAFASNISLSEFTWREYEGLTSVKQEALQCYFRQEDFEAWMQIAQKSPELEPILIHNPAQCTWAEYSMMELAKQEAMLEAFKNIADFEEWMNLAQKMASSLDTTWAMFEKMDPAKQEAFIEMFSSAERFGAWKKMAQAKHLNFEGRRLSNYRLHELEKMDEEKRREFIAAFESEEMFEAWQAVENERMIEAAKDQDDYSWIEYELMNPVKKELFFESFESTEAFEEWMNRVR